MSSSHIMRPEEKCIGKKCYIFDNEKYYKVKGMKGTYYIKVIDYQKVDLKQVAITIYEYAFDGLKKIRCYIKTIETSDILFIAGPKISPHFKMYDLEKN